MKELFFWAFLFVLLIQSAAIASVPEITASSAVLIDYQTGELLFAHNAGEKRPPASVTKIVTTYVAIKEGDLNSTVKVPREVVGTEGSSMYLELGEELSLHELLYGVMLSSGNDAAAAVACHISGSISAFSNLMNNYGCKLGAFNSNFNNPHGLPDENHWTTALDLALITRQAFNEPVFAEIVGTKIHSIISSGLHWNRTLRNNNRLLWTFPGADGVKTGYTNKAGRCLVASAKQNGRRVIAVLLNSMDLWGDAEQLLTFGLENFNLYTVVEKNDTISQVRVRDGDPVDVYAEMGIEILVSIQEKAVVKRRIILPGELKGPIPAGAPVGRLEIEYGGETFVTQLATATGIPDPNWRQRLRWFWEDWRGR